MIDQDDQLKCIPGIFKESGMINQLEIDLIIKPIEVNTGHRIHKLIKASRYLFACGSLIIILFNQYVSFRSQFQHWQCLDRI
jgi:hypothetical protein